MLKYAIKEYTFYGRTLSMPDTVSSVRVIRKMDNVTVSTSSGDIVGQVLAIERNPDRIVLWSNKRKVKLYCDKIKAIDGGDILYADTTGNTFVMWHKK